MADEMKVVPASEYFGSLTAHMNDPSWPKDVVADFPDYYSDAKIKWPWMPTNYEEIDDAWRNSTRAENAARMLRMFEGKLGSVLGEVIGLRKERDEAKREVEQLREVVTGTAVNLIRRRTALESEGGRLHAFAAIQIQEAIEEFMELRTKALAAFDAGKAVGNG